MSLCSKTSKGSKSWGALVHSLFCFSTYSAGLRGYKGEQTPAWSTAMVSWRSKIPQWSDMTQCENASSGACWAHGKGHLLWGLRDHLEDEWEFTRQRWQGFPGREHSMCKGPEVREGLSQSIRWGIFQISLERQAFGADSWARLASPFLFGLYSLFFPPPQHPSAVGIYFPNKHLLHTSSTGKLILPDPSQ